MNERDRSMHVKDSLTEGGGYDVTPSFPKGSPADSLLRAAPALLDLLATRLDRENNPLRTDPDVWPHFTAWALSVIGDCAWSLHHAEPCPRVGLMSETYWAELEETAWADHARHTGQAARLLFELISDALPDGLPLPLAKAALTTAQHETTLRMEAALIRERARFLAQEQNANQEFRRFLARELHDRIGGSVSLANRQLELYELLSVRAPDVHADGRLRALKTALYELNRQLRDLISDQRRSERAGSLEIALGSYVESLDLTGIDAQVDISGEESWVPPHFLDELFLVLRECLRNSVRHSGADRVHVAVRFERTEIRAIASDNGAGFDVDDRLERAARGEGGSGLLSLTERITALGGRVRFLSSPENGTRTMILVPIDTPSIRAETTR
ncbi:sensor histidine kinase [Nocardiopsis protaetiae]|uniref:sensor histidine kinase n=1 Tax=Nocardiopsis protaetiae TaxID=3382270 RepID=UPI00387AB9A8